MPAKDTCHVAVRNALEKDGWLITHDPYRLIIGRKRTYIDLAAELPLAAERDGQKIAVEIKGFLGDSELDDLEKALGQYGLYRVTLKKREPERRLYLAVPEKVRALLLDETDFRDTLHELKVNLLFFQVEQEVITEWMPVETIPP
jgi:hypothetical protein